MLEKPKTLNTTHSRRKNSKDVTMVNQQETKHIYYGLGSSETARDITFQLINLLNGMPTP